MLSQADIQEYHERGFLVPDFRLPQSTIQGIRDDHSEFISRYPQFTDYCPSLFVYDTKFLNYARNEALLDLVEQLIGPDIAIWNSSFFAKPAKVGSRTPWHQDGEYWPIRPLATCSVWIAVDDSTRANGCLEVLPGSHSERTLAKHHNNPAEGLALPLELDDDAIDLSRREYLELEAGQISLHDVYLAHASEPNLSDFPRRGMTLRFMPTSSIYRRDLENGLATRVGDQRTLFLMRGIDVSGQNDFRVRTI